MRDLMIPHVQKIICYKMKMEFEINLLVELFIWFILLFLFSDKQIIHLDSRILRKEMKVAILEFSNKKFHLLYFGSHVRV